MLHKHLILFILFIGLFSGCATEPVVKLRNRASSDRDILSAIRGIAKHGDWLVIRGIHASDHFVATATNMPLSHVGLLDSERDTVIEAEGIGVHSSTIEEYVAKSQRLMIIRPIWASEATARKAVETARKLIGKKYDFSGLIGINMPERYYCTELVISAYQPLFKTPNPIPPVIAPGQLWHWGTIVYDSGPAISDSRLLPQGSDKQTVH